MKIEKNANKKNENANGNANKKPLFYQRFEIGIDAFCILVLLLCHGVLVDIFQHIVCGVPHTLLGVFVWYAEGEHHGCMRVPQVMETVVL